MKKAILFIACCALSVGVLAKGSSHASKSSSSKSSSGSSHAVKGHTTKTGTYVAPHRATNPNKTKRDNWSHKGNVNPNTGKEGTKD